MNMIGGLLLLVASINLFEGTYGANMCYSCSKCLEPFNPTSVGPDNLVTYNVDVIHCPPGFNTCLTNLVEVNTGEVYGVRSCAPDHLCQPGVYFKNDTGMKITTSCCKTDLCISYNYFTFSQLVSSASRSGTYQTWLFYTSFFVGLFL